MYPVLTQLIRSVTSMVTIGYITLLRGNLGLDDPFLDCSTRPSGSIFDLPFLQQPRPAVGAYVRRGQLDYCGGL